MNLYHVNFHTWRNLPIFEHDAYDQMMRKCLPIVLEARGLFCPAWEIMPTHVHLIVGDFVDLLLPTIVKYVKGETSRAFFAQFPELRPDLAGGRLWRKGYYAAGIVTHEQFLATVSYIRNNRAAAGLLPPMALEAVE